MTIILEAITPQKILELAQSLTPADQRWLAEQLNHLLDETLLETITVNEAIDLYLTDQCSLGRAAELAGVTRWDILDILHGRGLPVEIYGHRTAAEIDALAEELEQ